MSDTAHPGGMTLSGGARIATALALALGTFMQILDTTIANVSIPTIAGDLGVSADQGTWVITSFAVANGVSVPLTAWLMQRYGVVRTFIASVVFFSLASFLCGASWSLGSLVVFRVVQGAVSGPLVPGSLALLLLIFPAERRPLALAIWSMTASMAPIFGPILGGYLSDEWSWPWIFFINVPVGVLCAAICWRNLAGRDELGRLVPVDWTGFVLLVVWVGALQIMLDKGKDADWFASDTIVALAIVCAIAFIAWIVWETTEEHPIVDLSLFATRNFGLGTLVYCIGYGVFFGNMVLLPLWLQTQLGYTATWAGLVSAPAGLVGMAVTLVVARIAPRADARLMATLSILAYALSYFMRSLLTPDADFASFLVPLLIQGIGSGIFYIAMVTISLHGIPPARLPSASGLSNFSRITVGSFAASVTTTLWDRREALHQTRLAEASSVFDPSWLDVQARLHDLGLPEPGALAALARELVNQAYVLASVDLFWLSTVLSIVLVPMVWLVHAARSGGPPAASD